jgi:hypothetical protein
VYQLFIDLVPLVKEAHRQQNTDMLRRAYDFAEWCLSQDNKELWNPVAVSFYEHLFDEEDLWREIVPWLSQKAITEVDGLWELMLKPDKYRQLLKVLGAKREVKREVNIFWKL